MREINLLINQLNEASKAYYTNDNPIMGDKEFDDLYSKLEQLEKETGIIMPNSPTQKVQGEILKGLKKVKHTKLMLSAQKTKDIEEIKQFANKENTYASWKLDGLTLVARYKDGKKALVLTRGSGDFGEDVTIQSNMIYNLPLQIPYTDELELRGECVISWDNFNKINESLQEKYSTPRNLAAGSIRTLNTNITKERYLEFVVFEVVNPKGVNSKMMELSYMDKLGFTTVERNVINKNMDIKYIVENMTPNKYKYPVDGLIFEYDNIEYSKSLGSTSHHENCRKAMKWVDDLAETTLLSIEWSPSRTGLLNPVAIFETVLIDGTEVSRASLSNISIMEGLELGVGDIINVSKRNCIIPKIEDNLTRSNTIIIPTECPLCGDRTSVEQDNKSKVLICTNPNCKGKLIGKLTHFVSKSAFNIEGLSDATLEFLTSIGWVSKFTDLYLLNQHKSEWMISEGFGKSSVTKLLTAIENSRNIKLENLLVGLGIPLVGKTASKDISKFCNGYMCEFLEYIDNSFNFSNAISGFGDTMNSSLYRWMNNHREAFNVLLKELTIVRDGVNQQTNVTNISLEGLTFVITGSVEHFKNRDELKAKIEELQGKVSGSVSAKTNFLINNDSLSTSGKNKKAHELGVKIITEEKFMMMI